MKNLGKNIFFWLIVGSLAFMLLENYQMGASKEELSFTEFKNEVKAKKVKSIVNLRIIQYLYILIFLESIKTCLNQSFQRI